MKKLFIICRIQNKEIMSLCKSPTPKITRYFFSHWDELQIKFKTRKIAETFIEKEKLYTLEPTITILPIYE